MAVTPALQEPEHIGPYRIDRRLGRGGMGEVYEGYDERLDRPVALKRVRPGTADPERAGKRFRREARAVSRLHHPSIVQVHDWVDTPEGEWIVMELVEGVSLRHLLRDGPLAPGRAARLARDVLEGLAAAHGEGIVHRDLKADNVMVTFGGSGRSGAERAKILDFGLAKKFEAGETQATETQVTEDGGIAGTLWALSPEQVLGRDVGPRSDLFSLGSLLYEMTAGVAPFRGGSAGEVLSRICTFQPRPVHTLNPNVPEWLSAFVDRLLEKDPRWRPQSAEEALDELEAALAQSVGPATQEVPETPGSPSADETEVTRTSYSPALGAPASAMTAVEPAGSRRARTLWVSGVSALLLTTAVVGLLWMGRPPETLYVAVAPTRLSLSEEARQDDPGYDLELAASAAQTALLRGLLTFRGLAALEPSAEEAPIEDPEALARATAADEVLASNLACGERICQLVLRRVRGSNGEVLWTVGFTVDPARLLDLSYAVLEHLGSAYEGFPRRRGVPDLEVRAEDYEAFVRLRQLFKGREERTSTEEILTTLEALEATSPRFLAVPLLQAAVLAQQFQGDRDPARLERAERALARARSIAPEDPRVLAEEAHIAWITGRLEELEAAVGSLERLDPGFSDWTARQAQLLERQGRTEEALTRMREAIRRRPSAELYFDLADMLHRRGNADAARRALEEGLARSPTSYSGRSRLAQLELFNGSTERAAELYEELVEQSAETPKLANLGIANLLLGRYPEAYRRLRQASELAPSSPLVTLNLADAALLLEQEEEAATLYSRVLEQVALDPRPEDLLSVRAQALAHLGRTRDAVAAVQEALRLAPEDPEVVYEAALVYALVGDEASALWNAERALAKGVEPRWFGFPWFDPLRDRLGHGGTD